MLLREGRSEAGSRESSIASIIGSSRWVSSRGVCGVPVREEWDLTIITPGRHCFRSAIHRLPMLVVSVHFRGEREPPCLVTPLMMKVSVNPKAVLIRYGT
jgi:hypothetical protein